MLMGNSSSMSFSFNGDFADNLLSIWQLKSLCRVEWDVIDYTKSKEKEEKKTHHI